MSRCELTGKSPAVKNKVSHSNIKTKSIAMPNVQKKRVFSKTLNEFVRLQISTSALRDMEHMGGFDTFILRQNTDKMSQRAMDARNRIIRKMKTKKTAKPAAAATTEAAAPAKAKAAVKATAKKAGSKK